jgi:hypothetical protein
MSADKQVLELWEIESLFFNFVSFPKSSVASDPRPLSPARLRFSAEDEEGSRILG